MNWTEGNLQRHARGRGWDRDRSRQKRAFASARASKTHISGPRKAQAEEASPFFSIGAKEQAQPEQRNAVASPPRAKRRKTSPVAVGVGDGDDLEARRRRLLERPDWVGIAGVRRDGGEAARQHFEAARASPVPGPALHHPKPVRREGVKLVRSLESRTDPDEDAAWGHGERGAVSVSTAETVDTDNLLPLSDTLPDVSVGLEMLEGRAADLGDEVSLLALPSELSEGASSLVAGSECEVVRGGVREERGDFMQGLGGEEDGWLDFIFEDGGEEVMRDAFEVASRDAARGLVPSVSSGASRVVECDSGSCGASDRATCGTGS